MISHHLANIDNSFRNNQAIYYGSVLGPL